MRSMEMEASGEASLRQKIAPLLQEFRATLSRLRNDLQRAAEAGDNSALFSGYQDGGDGFDDPEGGQQMDRLLMATQTQERTSKSLRESQRVAQESEDIGREVLANLHSQGETIRNSRNKLNESDEHLGRASKVLKALERSMMMENLLSATAKCMLGVLILFILYYMFTRSD
jgi:vesicle transport through interaction with t-SNAREs 1